MALRGIVSFLFPITCLIAIFQSTASNNGMAPTIIFTVAGTTTTILAAGMVYTRFCQVTELSTFTTSAFVLLLVNHLAVMSAVITFFCFLVTGALFIFDVKMCSTIGDILIYGVGNLYIWLQCLLTSYLSAFYYSKNLTLLRLAICCLSVVVFVVMLISGIAANIINRGSADLGNSCPVNTICHRLAAIIFCVFLMTYNRDHRHLDMTLQNDLMLDDRISVGSGAHPAYSSGYGPIHVFTHTSESLRKSLTPLVS